MNGSPGTPCTWGRRAVVTVSSSRYTSYWRRVMWNWREQIQLQIQAMKELQFLRVGIFDLHNYSACSHHYTTTVSYMHTSIDLWLCAWSLNERQLYEGQLHKKMVVSGSFYCFFWIRSATWLHTICAWDSSPHLPITPTQQMRLGIGQIVSWAVGNFNITSRQFFLKEMWSVDCLCTVCSCVALEQQAAGPQQADGVLQYF